MPQVLGDPDRLRGILLNLYTNAAKFTKKGAIALRVSVSGPNYRSAAPCPTLSLAGRRRVGCVCPTSSWHSKNSALQPCYVATPFAPLTDRVLALHQAAPQISVSLGGVEVCRRRRRCRVPTSARAAARACLAEVRGQSRGERCVPLGACAAQRNQPRSHY